MMISSVSGEFQKIDAQLETEGHDFSSAKASFSADIDSITTKQEQRDNHLKSAEFFDAENHPKLVFVSSKITKESEDTYQLHGDITIRGVSKPITFKVENNGIVKDPWGNQRTGFEISGKIKRSEFGLTYNPLLEAGGAVVGDDEKITANVEFVLPIEASSN
jgi:polyisoprenoid-binding protein YceI